MSPHIPECMYSHVTSVVLSLSQKNPRYLQLSVGRLHSVIVTIKIPNVHSCRKVKVSLDETVGELIR